MRVDAIVTQNTDCKVACGRESCIIFYKGEHCMFCKPTNEVLKEALLQFGLTETSILEIDVGEDESLARDAGVVGLPTIKICNETLLGLPDEGSIRDAIVNAMMQECFSE